MSSVSSTDGPCEISSFIDGVGLGGNVNCVKCINVDSYGMSPYGEKCTFNKKIFHPHMMCLP